MSEVKVVEKRVKNSCGAPDTLAATIIVGGSRRKTAHKVQKSRGRVDTYLRTYWNFLFPLSNK